MKAISAKLMKPPAARPQRGFALIEAIAALGVLATIAGGATLMSAQIGDDTRVDHAAGHMVTVGAAANYYLRNHRPQIEAVATATKAFRIDVNDLVTEGLLPSGSVSRNTFGQEVCTLVFQPAPGAFHALTIGEGVALDDVDLGYMAGLMGSGGGGVFAKAPSQILGSGGTWSLLANDYTNKANSDATGAGSQRCSGAGGTVQLAAGTPVLASWFAKDTLSQYLSRVDTGDPNDTTMRTRLKMGGNAMGDLVVVPPVTAGAPCTAAENGKPGYGTNNSFECSLSGGSYKWMAVTHCGADNAAGDLATSPTGELMMCRQQGAAALWKRASGYWQEPVQNWAALNAIACNANTRGETRVVQDAADGAGRPRAYTCNGAAWMAIALDNNGDLTLVRHVTASGNVTANGNVAALGTVSAGSHVTAGGNVAANGNVTANGSVWAVGNVMTNSNLIANGSVQIGAGQMLTSNGRIYIENPDHLYLKPTSANGQVFVGGNGGSGRLTTTGRLTTNEFVQVNGFAVENTGCVPNGLIARTAAGRSLSCVSGVWRSAGNTANTGVPGSTCAPGYYCNRTSGMGICFHPDAGTYASAPITWNGSSYQSPYMPCSRGVIWFN